MDKLIYLSMNGAKNSMRQLEILTNNLANVSTTGFRGDLTILNEHKMANDPGKSRSYAEIGRVYTDFKMGPTINTQRELDVAVDGDGFIAVQSKTGKEGYTRAGDLEIGDNGVLKTRSGQVVIGNAGAISVPSAQKIHVGNDGTISARFPGNPEMVPIDKIKLVNPAIAQMQKGTDGLFYASNGGAVDQDDNVKLITGALEGSNVNAIEVMTQIIDLSRSYEIHTNFMKTIGDNAAKSNQLLNLQS